MTEPEINIEETKVFTEEDIKENNLLMKRSTSKLIRFLIYTVLILVAYFLFRKNPLFIFTSEVDTLEAVPWLFNLLSYTAILATFLYMFYYFAFFLKRRKLTDEEKLGTLQTFRKRYNLFDLVGVIPLFLVVLMFVNGIFYGFATVYGPSMEPTFYQGDYVVIDHFNYDLLKDDIIIFKHDGKKIIKRVIGVEGDHVVVNQDGVFVNGDLKESYLPPDWVALDVIIPEGNFFVMGDHRDNSNDSRHIGLVTPDMILGEVVMKIG